jgi:hypothetical protein
MLQEFTIHESSPSDLNTWQAFFNVMLKDAGVRGIKVQELYSLDSDMLAILPYDLASRIHDRSG